MGSRISISLVEFLNNPKITVELSTEVIPDFDESKNLQQTDEHAQSMNARIAYVEHDIVHVFDAYVSENGKIELEADFNYFRHEDRYRSMMYLLFEHSISFRVITG